jgi:hypothetical protein
MIMSMQITEAPRMHATPLREVITHPRSSFVSTIVTGCSRQCRNIGVKFVCDLAESYAVLRFEIKYYDTRE